MKYKASFTFKKGVLEKAIDVAITREGLIKKSLLKRAHSHDDPDKYEIENRGAILLASVAIGLIKLGFSKEQALSILESMFILEISKGEISPGNDEIH